MPIGSSVRALIMFAVLFACVPVWAQSPTFDAHGLQQNRLYQELAPFEHIDTMTGNLILSFTDLELPGDAGFSLRVQRTYNLKEFGPVGRHWTVGLADVPMLVRFPNGPPAGELDPERFYPVLVTTDGALHRTGPSGVSTWRTEEFWEYRHTDHRVDLPNGLVCHFDTEGFLIRIDSTFGILAEVFWDSANPQPASRAIALIRQHVGGATRDISFTQDSSSWPLPKTMTFGFRQWTYDFEPDALLKMRTVTLPNGSSWQFSYGTQHDIGSVITPNGGQINYDTGSHAFEYSPGTPNPVFSTVLLHREVVARPNRDEGGTWSYLYPGPTSSPRITIVNGPHAIRKAYFYELLPPNDGRYGLTRTETWDDSASTLVQIETRQYVASAAVANGQRTLLSRRAVIRDGRTYETFLTYSDLDWGNFGQPYRIDETGDFARTTVRVFEQGFKTPFNGAAYLPALLHQESVSVNGETYVKTFDHEPSTGFRWRETVFTIPHTFERDARGNVMAEIDGVGLRTSYTYAWGIVANTQTPEYLIERSINSDSTLAWEKRNGRTTSYEYDGLFRQTLMTPPEGFAMSTTFETSGQSVTQRRGGGGSFAETRYTLDGMGRVVGERNTVGVNQLYAYDVYGRRTGQSLPFYDGATPTGTTWDYDVLNRVIFETYADGNEKRFQHANGDLRIIDEQDRHTVQDWEASGHPDNRRLAAVVDAASSHFVYRYTGLGRLARVEQPGGTARSWVFAPGTDLLTSETHPESGTTTYINDGAGRLRTRTDATGRSFEHHYDGNNRVLHIDVSDSSEYDSFFDYDDADNRTVARNGFVASTFAYDGANRLRQRTDVFPAIGAPFVTAYTYTGFDQVDTLTYPSSTVVDYDYDREGRLTLVKRGGSTVMHVLAHHPSGAPAHTQLGNGREEARTYDELHRPDAIALPGLNLNYDYYDAGNVQRIVDARPGYTQEFEYDPVDRLSVYRRGATNIIYNYDPLGNRTRNGLSTYIYNATTLRLEQWAHGPLGQVTNDGQASYSYTPTSVPMILEANVGGIVTSYRYDADGLRKITIPSGGPHEYVVHGDGTQVLTEALLEGAAIRWARDYIYADNQLVAGIRPAAPTGPKPVVSFMTSAQQVSEAAGAVSVAIQLDTRGAASTTTPIDVVFNTQDGTATAHADYLPIQNLVFTIPAGSTHGQQFSGPLTIVNDSRPEPNEHFAISFTTNPQQADAGIAAQTVTILNDDALTISFAQASQQVSEGIGNAVADLIITTVDGQPIGYGFTINVQAVGISPAPATPGADFQVPPSTVNVPVGTPSGHRIAISVFVVDDRRDERTERFEIRVTAAPTITVANPAHAVAILDNDSPTLNDFNGDGRSDIALFRPSTGTWFLYGIAGTTFGGSGDIPVPADYDGDGDTDIAVFRPSTSTWYGAGPVGLWGGGGDVPAPADYDGDGDADVAVFRPSTGEWYIWGLPGATFGGSGDIPVPADYDGDGDADIAVFRPSTGRWYVAGQLETTFGGSGDVPVPADYDGDGDADIAVFRPSTGRWYVYGQFETSFGGAGDVPVPADYDGDGDTDIAVFRPYESTWFLYGLGQFVFGGAGDIPFCGWPCPTP